MNADAFASWHSEFLADGLHFYRKGQGKAVVLLHGLTDDGQCWGDLAVSLARDFDVVLPDARGHGLSSRDRSRYNFNALAGDAMGLIHELRLERPALVGHSMGAVTAAMVAANESQDVARLVLEEPPFFFPQPPPRALDTAPPPTAFTRSIERVQRLPPDVRADQIRHEHPRWSDASILECQRSDFLVDLDVISAISQPQFLPWQETVQRIACPLLVIGGNPVRGAVLGDPEADFLRALPIAPRVEKLENAGHCVRRDSEEQYEMLVRAFLSEG